MKKLLLVDGNAMLFRAYYATAYGSIMRAPDGTPTNAIFGFASMLQKALELLKPDAMMVAFDAGKHTFRHELFADYKGGRRACPEELVPQFDLVRQFLSSLNICWKEMADIEADDLIGTYSRLATDFQTYILSSDRDLLQLIDSSTTVMLMKKGLSEFVAMDEQALFEELHIVPSQIIDLKGLMGDKSDNIPGIPGVGEKTALNLLATYQTVENVLEHQDELKGALAKKVKEHQQLAILSKKLATIRRDVELVFDEQDIVCQLDYQQGAAFLKTLGMNTLSKRFLDASMSQQEAIATDLPYQVIKDMDETWMTKSCAIFAVDDGQSFMQAKLYGFGLYDGEHGYYLPIDQFAKAIHFQQYLGLKDVKKIGYDCKRLKHLLHRKNVSMVIQDDVMISSWLVDTTINSLDKLCSQFDYPLPAKVTDIFEKSDDLQKQMEYACHLAKMMYEVHHLVMPKIQEYQMERLYRQMELPLADILYTMEEEGICCDNDILDQIATDTYAKIVEVQNQIYALANTKFNINSPKQMAEVLFDGLGIPETKKRSTAAGELEKRLEDHPIIEHILMYRKLSKIYSTYAEGLKKYITADGKIHTVYNQNGTQTGRMSSTDPNLQNISVRDELGKEIRKAFLPEQGCVLISSDYHQVELRILAHMADETSLIEAFNQNIDIHTKTAMDIFHVPMDEVTPQMRRDAKTVNFGIVYGISDFGLAEQLGVSRKQAKEFIEKYYAAYPKIQTFMAKIVEECKENGYVTTLWNRRRDIPEIHSSNFQMKEFGKRAAMNAPIQGTAADLIKLAMIHVYQLMQEKQVKSKMILQVHDELIFNVVEDEIELMKKLIEEGMTKAMSLKVPLPAECSVGHDWYSAK